MFPYTENVLSPYNNNNVLFMCDNLHQNVCVLYILYLNFFRQLLYYYFVI